MDNIPLAERMRPRDLDQVVGQEHLREAEPAASGACLADAAVRGWLELPNFDHAVDKGE